MEQTLKHVLKAFCIYEEMTGWTELKNGNINRTFCIDTLTAEGKEKHYIAQRVNTYVFKHPDWLMENIDRVTEYIRACSKPGTTTLHFHHTEDRKNYVEDGQGFWRLFNYVESETYNICTDLNIIRNAGKAFGEFQGLLKDFDAAALHETIPNFHNTASRYDTLMQHVAEDPCGKVNEVLPEIEWLKEVREIACRLCTMQEAGELPLRVTHNDTKINNVLFSVDDHRPLVVIDLDTVMPGLVAYDFGDAIRFAANYVEEDSPEAEKAGINMDIFRAFAEGFLSETAEALTENEINTLALGAFVMTTELVVRFLDDYICGSPYFKTLYPEHNLVRTRCQMALAKDMLKHMDEMENVIRELSTGV